MIRLQWSLPALPVSRLAAVAVALLASSPSLACPAGHDGIATNCALVQFDDAYAGIVTSPGAIGESTYLAGPYLGFQLSPHLLLDGKLAWSIAEDNGFYGDSLNAAPSETQALSEVRLSGMWNWNDWNVTPSGALVRGGELNHSALSGLPGTKVDTARILVGPELRRQIDAGDGNRLEPFVFLKTSLDLEKASPEPTKLYNMIGGGFVLSRPNDYTIRAIADYSSTLTPEVTDLTSSKLADDDVLSGKIQVNVPLQ